MELTYYVFAGGLWCKVINMGYSPFEECYHYGYLAITNTDRTYNDFFLDELLDTVQFFEDTTPRYFAGGNKR